MEQGQEKSRDRRKETEEYECMRCSGRQIEAATARVKGIRIKCRNCGNVAYPVKEEVVRKRVCKVCKHCGVRLRAGNSSSACSLCNR